MAVAAGTSDALSKASGLDAAPVEIGRALARAMLIVQTAGAPFGDVSRDIIEATSL